MKKITTNSKMLVPALTVLGILLVIAGVFQPWFSVRTSPEFRLITNSTMSMDIDLFQTVIVTRTDGNVTNALTFTLSNDTAYASDIFQAMTGTRTDTNAARRSADVNVTETVDTTITFNVTDIGAYRGQVSQTDQNETRVVNSTGTFTTITTKVFNGNVTASMKQKSEITTILGTTTALTVAGLVFSILAPALVLISGKTKRILERYAYVFGILGALLLLVGPMLTAANVTNFWGSLQLSPGAFLWKNEAIMTWGPSIGWYLTLAAALMLLPCSLFIRTAYLDKKRVLATQSLK